MNNVIYFDIDRTLIDSVKLRELTRGGMCKELNLNREKINVIIDDYIKSLNHKNDFCREDMLEIIRQKTGHKYLDLKNTHDKYEYYFESLYDDVINTLEKLKKENNVLGIYSEGHYDYQLDKLMLSGIYKYFDIDKIIIKRKKLRDEEIKIMGEAIVIDDWVEVIDYLSDFPKITPIWLNRVDERKHKNARTIYGLGELVI
ncbi:MAG: HAD hydrolase-like protein [Candidatus Shapirobacteria bacterium]